MEDQIKTEEDACWAILTRELLESTPYIEVVITVEALVQEVQA